MDPGQIRNRDPGRIQDGSGMGSRTDPGQTRDGLRIDQGRIQDGSTTRIRPGLLFLFPAIQEQYVRTIYSGSIYSGSIQRHYILTYV
jgi:hypothetical protein